MSTDAQRQAFRKGFLEKLANEGITPEKFGARIKVAFNPLGAAALAVLAGGAGGYLLGNLGGRGYAAVTTPDPDEYAKWLRNQELITAYRQAIQSVKKKAPSAEKDISPPPTRKSVTSLFKA